MIGATLLHYRIVHSLGAGGMGEVFAADDTRLNRRVALKLLPPVTARDPERLQRFRREAQAVAALNHPNVVTIYSVEEADGLHFLTMELIEGQTLAALIPTAGLPWASFFRWAVPLADAVSAAHERGVIHRDLKPANVMITARGTVKVLDFGLAKLRPEVVPSEISSLSTARVTAPYEVMGTTAYMSPEQAEGRSIDARTDIFSLGVVLFEMAAGRRPFAGETTMSLISSILKDPAPPLAQHRRDAPSELERILRRCLAKDPARRYQTALDLRNDLEDLHQQTTTAAAPMSSGASLIRPRGVPGRVWIAIAAAAAVALIAYAAVMQLRPGTGSRPLQVSFSQLTHAPGIEWFPSLSPDGRWVVYAADSAGNRDIYLQSVTGSTPINLTADSPEDDDQPAFSPDGESIAFRSNREGGGIFVMGRTGERVRRLTRAGFNPAWAPDGRRLAFTSLRLELRPQNSEGLSELWIADLEGGDATRLSRGDATLPSWSPNGRFIAYGQRLGDNRNMDIQIVAVDGSSEAIHAVRDDAIDWNPVWAPDGRHLYFISDRSGSPNLWRLPVDPATGAVRGGAEPLTSPAAFAAHVTVSADGRHLAYASVLETQNVYRLPFDPERGEPAGEPRAVTTGTRFWSSPDPSPDGRRLVMYSQVRPEGDLYVSNTDGTGLRQLTSDAAIDRVPRWSPDGEWIATFSNRSGTLEVWKLRADGSDLQALTTDTDSSVVTWSPDGSQLAVTHARVQGERGPRGSYLMRAGAPLAAQTPAVIESTAGVSPFVPNSWSPDGRQLAGQPSFSTLGILVYAIAEKTFTHVAQFGEWPVWLPDSRRVLAVSRGREFHVIDTLTKESRLVYRVPRDTLGPPRLTPDGRHAYFSRRATESDVWLVTLEEPAAER